MSTPITPVELSLLMDRHRPLDVPPCRVCGAELAVGSMGGGQATVYHCSSDAASLTAAYRAARARGDDASMAPEVEESREHWCASEFSVTYHGDEAVYEALVELRQLRRERGEDMTVPTGAYAYPYGHAACWNRRRHLGDDRWTADPDFDYTHDPSHRPGSSST